MQRKTCHLCGTNASDGPGTHFVRVGWPFVVWVCGRCYRKHVTHDRLTLKAWRRKWLWKCLFLWAASWGILLGFEKLAEILPLTLVEIPEVHAKWVQLSEPRSIEVDGQIHEITAVEIHEGASEAAAARDWNTLYKERFVFGLGTLLQAFAWSLFWWTYRRASKTATLMQETSGKQSHE